MNFRTKQTHSVVLSSHRVGAPYDDVLVEDGTVLLYEGHDEPKSRETPYPKLVDQPLYSKNGKPTQNGYFHQAAQAFVSGKKPAIRVRVYEKIKAGIWSYNGLFELQDSHHVPSGDRKVYKFKLRLISEDDFPSTFSHNNEIELRRIIPSSVKLAVWKRDNGACVECGSTENLHFDHILPFSKGGTSETESNIQLLCMKHNTQKGSKIL